MRISRRHNGCNSAASEVNMVRSLLALLALASIAGADEVRPLKLEAVDQVIEKSDRAIQSCGRSRKETLAVLLRLDIDPDGRVINAAVTGKMTQEAACVARVARKLRFPATGTDSHVEYPFMIGGPTLSRY
jgi:hypothetical protein